MFHSVVAISKACGVDSKTLLQQNTAVLNWGCQLAEVDLYYDCKVVVVVLLLSYASLDVIPEHSLLVVFRLWLLFVGCVVVEVDAMGRYI